MALKGTRPGKKLRKLLIHPAETRWLTLLNFPLPSEGSQSQPEENFGDKLGMSGDKMLNDFTILERLYKSYSLTSTKMADSQDIEKREDSAAEHIADAKQEVADAKKEEASVAQERATEAKEKAQEDK